MASLNKEIINAKKTLTMKQSLSSTFVPFPAVIFFGFVMLVFFIPTAIQGIIEYTGDLKTICIHLLILGIIALGISVVNLIFRFKKYKEFA